MSLRHLHLGKQRFRGVLNTKAPLTPFLRRPASPAAGSETHFLARPLEVALQAHKQEAALFHVPPPHAAHVKAREAGRCARVSWSGREAESFHCVALPVITPETKQRDASVPPRRRSLIGNQALKILTTDRGRDHQRLLWWGGGNRSARSLELQPVTQRTQKQRLSF